MGERAPWIEPTINDVMTWGKCKGMSYRDAARTAPGFLRWVAQTIPGIKGRLAAEALALALGVAE